VGNIILRTSDGGTTWMAQPTTVGLRRVSCPDANTCTAVTGYNQTDTRFLHTTDGGTTWISQFFGVTADLIAVSCPDANTCTVIGGSGTILRTTMGLEAAQRRDQAGK
jgi:photosystem II stability/assembly factor-like uncharacterized protein